MESLKQCIVCQKKTDLTCPLCRNVFYCSKEHQKKDWKHHKTSCEGYQTQSQNKSSKQSSEVKSQKQQQNTNITENIFSNNLKQGNQIKKENQEKNPIYQKQLNLRILDYKKKLKQRQLERNVTLYNYLNGNLSNALISVKRLILMSQKIAQQTTELICQEYQRKDLIRTTKYLQQLEYLNDYVIYCKINQKSEKKAEVKKIFNDLPFPKFQIMQFKKKPQTKRQMLQLNYWREEIAKYSSILKELILITTQLYLIHQTENLYQRYIDLIKSTSGEIDLATVYFEFANTYLKFKNMKSARQYFILCKSIRQRYGDSQPLADVIMNLGLIQYYINTFNKQQAISLIEESLRIRRDKIQNNPLCVTSALESLGKIYLEIGDPEKSLKYLKECFMIRQKYLSKKNKQKKRIEVLIIFLYKTMKQKLQTASPEQQDKYYKLIGIIQKQLFNYDQFQDYNIDGTQGMEKNHFNVNFNQRFFNKLNDDQIMQLKSINEVLQKYSYKKGIEYFKESKFYKNLSNEKKDQLDQLNPGLEPLNTIIDIMNLVKF